MLLPVPVDLPQAVVQPRGRAATVLAVGIDRLRALRDTLGRDVGDEVVASVGSRLEELTRRAGPVTRVGDDEFHVLLPDGDQVAGETWAQRIVEEFHRFVPVDGRSLQLLVSVGVATAPAATDLPRGADLALHWAQSRGGGQWATFQPRLGHDVARRLELEQALAGCLERAELALHYQPICRVTDGEVVGAETLLRWSSRDHGRVPPNEFVPVLEETGMIIAVGAWVLREGLRQLAAWRRAGAVTDRFNLAINVSPRQLGDRGVVDLITDSLHQYDIRARDITLEITETALMCTDAAVVTVVDEVADLGVGISLDDFATGYSSLAILRSLPVTQLKIDQQFVAGMLDSTRDAVVAKTIIELAHASHLSCVAEGVETHEQLVRLRELGCDLAQGFHLGLPVSAAEFDQRRPASRPGDPRD